MDKTIKPVELLFIERNPGNLRQFIEVFNESRIPYHFRFTGNGDEAIRMIFKMGEYSNFLTPDLIISDVYSIRKGGTGVLFEVLDRIAKTESISCIPTVILTKLEKVVELELQNCPNLLIPKPDNLDEYKKVAESIEKFWLKNVQE